MLMFVCIYFLICTADMLIVLTHFLFYFSAVFSLFYMQISFIIRVRFLICRVCIL